MEQMQQVEPQEQRPAPRFVPRRDTNRWKRVQWARHGVQTAFVLWLVVTMWQKAAQTTEQGGSVEAVCPFGGFETLWTWVATGRTVPHTHLSNLVLAGVITVLAVLARGFFCGWICVLGSLQEGVRAVGRRIETAIPGLSRLRRTAVRRMPWLPSVDRALHYGRYAVLAWALGGAAITGTMVFREIDPWSALLSIIEFEFSTGFTVLIVSLVLALFIDRPFCRYACPLGATQGLIAKVSPVAIQRNAETCLGCEICNDACPMHLQVNQRTRVTDGGCIGCLQCVAACPSRDALALTITSPTMRKEQVDVH